MGMLAGVAAMAAGVAPSQAAYGDAANVFGRVTNKSGSCPLSKALSMIYDLSSTFKPPTGII